MTGDKPEEGYETWGVTFRVKPKMDFTMAGTWPRIKLDKTKEYEAIHASNQPDWEEEGKIFVIGAENDGGDIGFLLSRDDYLLIGG
jgi:hypothetical protein